MRHKISFIENCDINKEDWDIAISKSHNSLVYARSFFLDEVCNWHALIIGNYDFVMPLPYRKKKGIEYIYNPIFIPQLGVFSIFPITEDIVIQFLLAIPKHFKYIDIMLNESNLISQVKKISIRNRINYVLPLSNTYFEIERKYTKDAKRNIKKANTFNLSITNNIEIEEVFLLYHTAYGNLNKSTLSNDYKCFLHAAKECIKKKYGFTIVVLDAYEEILAAAFFTVDERRVTYMLGAPTARGRLCNATHFLLDAVIKRFSETNLYLDFEGSDIENVAKFYRKFSPVEKTYQHVVINKLPILIRWLK